MLRARLSPHQQHAEISPSLSTGAVATCVAGCTHPVTGRVSQTPTCCLAVVPKYYRIGLNDGGHGGRFARIWSGYTLMQIPPPTFSRNTAHNSPNHTTSSEKFIFLRSGPRFLHRPLSWNDGVPQNLKLSPVCVVLLLRIEQNTPFQAKNSSFFLGRGLA